MRSSATFTKSKSPTDTPPLVMTASQRSTASRSVAVDDRLVVVRRAEVDRVSSRHSASSASSIGRLESRICPGASGPRLDELVAGREHADARPRVRAHVGGRRGSPARRCGAAVEHRPRARTPRRRPRGRRRRGARGRPGSTSRVTLDAVVAVARGALDHHDRVGAVGHRGAGHDPDRLPRPDRDGRARARRRARPPPAAAPGAPRSHRWCRRPAPRSRPSRCWRTAEPPRARRPARRGRARGRRPGRPRPARGGGTAPRIAAWTSASGHHDRPRRRTSSRRKSPQLGPEVGRGRGRARCWPAGSRASADVVAAVARTRGRTPARVVEQQRRSRR